jgi:hypothetical protein
MAFPLLTKRTAAALSVGVLSFGTATVGTADAVPATPAEGGAVATSAATMQARALWRPNGTVRDIVVTRDRVYLAGSFNRMINHSNGHKVRRLRVAALDRRTGELIRTFRTTPTGGQVNAIDVVGNRLILGGAFTQVAGHKRHHLAAVRLGSGELIRTFHLQVDGPVLSLASTTNRIYVGGAFSSVSGTKRSDLFKATVRGRLVPGWPNQAAVGTTGGVYALAANARGTFIYVGGVFKRLGGVQRDYLGRVRVRSGRVGAWNPAPLCNNCFVMDMSVSKARTFVGAAGGDGAGAYRNTNASMVWKKGADGAVTAIARAGRRVFLGGHFHTIGGTRHIMYAEALAASGRILPRRPETAGRTFPGILALTARGAYIRAGGAFRSLNHQAKYALIAK